MNAWDDLTDAARELVCERSELDIAEDYVTLSARYDAVVAQLAALREGEEPYEDERLVPTPGQWITLWNRATPAERLEIAANRLDLLERANRCVNGMHEQRLAERWADLMAEKQRAEQAEAQGSETLGTLLRVERERCDALIDANEQRKRAEQAEARLASVRAVAVRLRATEVAGGWWDGLQQAADDIDAALDGPAEQPAIALPHPERMVNLVDVLSDADRAVWRQEAARWAPIATILAELAKPPAMAAERARSAAEQPHCCICGTTEPGGRTFYENYQDRLFCWPCADGDRPTCPLGDACAGTACTRLAEHGPRTTAGGAS